MVRAIQASLLAVLLAAMGGCAEDSGAPSASEASAAPASASASQPERPNIIFIMTDDMGWGDVGYQGSEIATPNLDEMARAGLRLDRNYAYPICSPTRAAFMTGHSPLIYGIDSGMSDAHGLPTEVRILPQYLQDLGYQTWLVGKWHLGLSRPEFLPNARGFDYSYGHLGGWIDFYTHVYSGGLDWHRNGQVVREEGHATDLLTADAVRMIANRDPNQPFFLFMSYNAPHSPLQYIPQSTGLNDHIPDGNRKVYAEMMTQTDAGIGAIIAALQAEQILTNTLIIFSSDNGGDLEQGASNGELRAAKSSTYEGGIRVPGLVWWPGQVEGGRVMSQQIISHDWLPTLLEAAGGDPAVVPDPHGQSMWAAIAHDTPIQRKVTTIGVAPSSAVFDLPWKLVRHTTPRFTNEGPTPQLFNLELDPLETTNRATDEPEIYARLSQVLDAFPSVPSLRSTGPSPDAYFLNAEGTGWNFEVRLPEVREPWLSTAE